MIVSFSIFRRRFHKETIVFLKNENVTIPTCIAAKDLAISTICLPPEREGVQRRHDPHKNDLQASGFAELPPGPAKLVSQPP